MQDTTIAVDVAKSVFEVAVSQRPGKVAERQRLSRGQFSRFLQQSEPATFVMEACGTAHWAREERRAAIACALAAAPVRTTCANKTDSADAKACSKAYERPIVPFP